MRKELELIEKIEAYLQGRLSPAETQQLERQMAGDPQLQEEVELQRQLMTGIDRASLKEEVLSAKKRFTFRRNFLKWGLAGLVAAMLTIALFYYRHQIGGFLHSNAHPDTTMPAYKDDRLTTQTFLISPSRDTVITTKKGIEFSLPANTFLDEKNQPVTGQIRLTIKEALDPSDIMTAGLSTKSGNQLLATGGMFFLDVRQEERILHEERVLHIDTTRPVLAKVPARPYQPGMQLYKGRRLPDGTIDWVEPRPLEPGLQETDLQSLNFYPPGYQDSLQKWGYDSRNKHFTDSLYYSFTRPSGGEAEADALKRDTSFFVHPCGIEPAKIKTIWSQEFQHTFIATREFEQRLYQIHRSGDDELLDLYVKNLDQRLSYIDSLAANRSTGRQKDIFLEFAARKDGKVNITADMARKLAAHYHEKSRALSIAAAKATAAFWQLQAKLENAFFKKAARHQIDSSRRVEQNFNEEYIINLKSALRQLGYDTLINPAPPLPTVYTVTVTTTGWCNIDKAVYAATSTRTTLNYTDSSTGKTAVIRYLPASFRIPDWKNYDRLYVYLLPDRLSSFILLSGADGAYTEKLDELMKYDLLCMGYKGEEVFYYHQSGIQPQDYAGIQLSSISKEELTQRLNQAGNRTQAAGLQKENEFYQFDLRDAKERERMSALIEFMHRTEKLIFPCMRYQ